MIFYDSFPRRSLNRKDHSVPSLLIMVLCVLLLLPSHNNVKTRWKGNNWYKRPSQLDHFQLLYTDSSVFNDHENNCLQWKAICFGLSDRGEMCPVSEVLPVIPRDLQKVPLDWKLANLLMQLSAERCKLLWVAYPAILILVALRHAKIKNGWWPKIIIACLREVSHWK